MAQTVHKVINMKTKIYGFSLVEMMIVVAILGLLVTLGVPGFIRSRDKARRDTCVNNLRIIENAADQYRIDYNLSFSTPVSIISLWPSSSSVKNVSSYINKQLFCPVKTNKYVGGTDSGKTSLPSDMNITANGSPHCSTNSGTVYELGKTFEHSID